MRRKILLLVIFVLGLFLPLRQALSQELQPQAAPPSQEFLDWLSEQNSPVPLDKSSNNSGYATGYIPDPVDYSHLNYKNAFNNSPVPMDKAGSLPTTYDLRSLNRVSSVKNQNPYGTCWAHAAMGALESNYLTQNSGAVEPNLSELHLAWFVYKDPNAGKAFSLINSGNTVLNQGGNSTMAIAFLSRMAGAVNETSMPYTGASTVETDASGKSPSNYFPRTIYLTEAYKIGNVDSNNRDTVKELIQNNGAVQISYYAGSGATSSSGGVTSYYETSGSNPNHAVLIVGWDDNYATSNFTSGAAPSANGAWIVKNSWGENWPSTGDGGYFYMSYEQNITNATAYVISSTMPGANYYGYDDLGYVGSVGYGDVTAWGANVFQASDNEQLTAVSFQTNDVNTQYEIYAFDLGSSKPSKPVPSSTSGATAIASGSFTYAGYHTVYINSGLEISAGNYFSIVIKFTNSTYKFPVPTEYAMSNNYTDNAVVNVGESYFYTGDTIPTTWTDGATGSPARNVCIKAFTTTTSSATTGIELNAANFPNSTFLNYVKSNFDTDSDGYLTDAEIAAITKINVSGKGISDLTGIEYFTALTELSCYGNSLTALDITKNIALQWLDCSDNQLTTLDLSKNTNLLKLYCGKNNLTTLDVEANRNLTVLDCHSNSLSALYLRNLSNLTSLTCDEQIIYGISFTSVNDYYTVDLSSLLGGISKAYIDASSFKAYDYEGNLITTSVNSNLWKVTLSDIAYYIQYQYDTGYNSKKMTVTLKTQKEPELVILSNDIQMVVGQEYSYQIAKVTGEPDFIWSVTNLPDGLTFSEGKITGTPTTKGSKTLTLNITNDYGSDTDSSVKITVLEVPKITNTESDLGYVKFTENPNITLTADGSATITWTFEDTGTATHPSGLTISGTNNSVTLTKGSSEMTAGTYNFVVVAENSVGSDKKEFKIRITRSSNEPPVIVTDYADNADDTYDYNFTLQAEGYLGNSIDASKLVWSLASGSLPDGLTLNSDGTITGTPTGTGTFTFVVKVYRSDGSSSDADTKTITLTVNATPPEITSDTLNAGTVNVDYSGELLAKGSKTLVWSITSGALPSGLTLNTDGTITGKPTEYGSFTFTVAVDNDQGTDDAEFTLEIDEPGLEINAENFPDENFRAYISEKIDTNSNGYLSDAEITAVTQILAYSKNIADLTGIEYFTEITQLYCHNNSITSIDLTNNTKLTLIQANNNSMVSIDLSGLTKLSNLQLQNNKLLKLDLSENAIKALQVQNNNLSELDLSVTPITSAANVTLSTQTLSGLIISRSDDVYVADITGFVSDVSKISSAKAYDDSDTEITSTFTDGVIQAESLPAYILYEYDTGKLSMTMDVKVSPNPEPVIVTPKSLPGITSSDIINSNSYSYTFEATGDTPLTWTLESGSLPDGLTLDADSGVISGTPTYSGTSKFVLSVANSAGSISKDFTLYVAPVAPIFNLETLQNAPYGEEYSQELNVTGTKPIDFAIVDGSLPDGLSMNSSTGAITGTPTKGGAFEFTIEASNRVNSVRQSYTITVTVDEGSTPEITTSAFDAATLKVEYTADLEATGSGDITWSVSSGKLPTGLKISDAQITGTPTAKGTYTFTLKAANSYGSDTKEFSIIVTEVPVISTTKLTNGTVGKSYTAKLAVKNSIAVEWALTEGTLPAGLEFDTDTGKITGTPEECCTNLELTFTATNDVGSNSKTLKLTIKGVKPTIKSVAKNFSAGVVGQEYSGQLSYTGTTPITLTVTNLPEGLTMSSTGEITGTPTKSGTFNTTFKAVNATGSVTKKIKIEVYDLPEIYDTALKDATYGKSYSATFKLAKGAKKVTWTLADGSNELPKGLKISKAGKLSGTPKVYGTFTFKLNASTTVGDAQKEFTLVINPVAPKITTSSVKAGKVNANYSVKLKATGTAPLTWALASGVIPNGITLDASTGALTGSPTEAGTFNFTVSLTNDAGTALKSYKMTIKPLKPVFSVNFADATVGQPYSMTLVADVGSPVTWSMTKVAGLTIDSNTGVISGTPTKAGTFKVTVKAKNASGTVSEKDTLTVNAAPSESSTYAADLTTESTNENDSENYFDDAITNSGTLSEFERGEVTEDMLNLAFSDEYSIAAVLNAISVSKSGYYEIAVELDENAEDGELNWFGFPVDVDENELQSYEAIFYDASGAEIVDKPENNLITVSVYLEEGIIYKPVIAIKAR